MVSLVLAAAVPVPPPNGFGALVDRGGKAALAVGLVAGAGAAEDAENGFLGAAVLMGGNALLLEAAGFAAAAAGAGAFVVAEKGVGALAARGGKLALEDGAAFSSFFSTLSGTLEPN